MPRAKKSNPSKLSKRIEKLVDEGYDYDTAREKATYESTIGEESQKLHEEISQYEKELGELERKRQFLTTEREGKELLKMIESKKSTIETTLLQLAEHMAKKELATLMLGETPQELAVNIVRQLASQFGELRNTLMFEMNLMQSEAAVAAAAATSAATRQAILQSRGGSIFYNPNASFRERLRELLPTMGDITNIRQHIDIMRHLSQGLIDEVFSRGNIAPLMATGGYLSGVVERMADFAIMYPNAQLFNQVHQGSLSPEMAKRSAKLFLGTAYTLLREYNQGALESIYHIPSSLIKTLSVAGLGSVLFGEHGDVGALFAYNNIPAVKEYIDSHYNTMGSQFQKMGEGISSGAEYITQGFNKFVEKYNEIGGGDIGLLKPSGITPIGETYNVTLPPVYNAPIKPVNKLGAPVIIEVEEDLPPIEEAPEGEPEVTTILTKRHKAIDELSKVHRETKILEASKHIHDIYNMPSQSLIQYGNDNLTNFMATGDMRSAQKVAEVFLALNYGEARDIVMREKRKMKFKGSKQYSTPILTQPFYNF